MKFEIDQWPSRGFRRRPRALELGVWIATAAASASAQPVPMPLRHEYHGLDSQNHENPTAATVLAFRGWVDAPSAPWMRLRIGEYDLGSRSFITLTSLEDGGTQRLDHRGVADWHNLSAVFRGDTVEVQLHVAPGEADVFVVIDEAISPDLVKLPHGVEIDEGGIASICGASDDRVASNDARVGRVWFGGPGGTPGGCTAWLVSNGAALTAGHCGIALGDLIEFNLSDDVSDARGNPSPSDPADQYPVANPLTNVNNEPGDDYAVFGLNANNGVRAHRAQGFFVPTKMVPDDGETIRITGFGLDNQPNGLGNPGANCCDSNGNNVCEFNCNSSSLEQQTETGPYDDFSGGGTIHEYVVDTQAANSGSPIIWDCCNVTIGIHTTGGCDDFFAGNDNEGTAFGNNGLESTLELFPGANVVYVNEGLTGAPENGTIFEPWGDVAEGVADVPDGGIISIVEGTYTRVAGNVFTVGADGKAMTFQAPVGTVTIGP